MLLVFLLLLLLLLFIYLIFFIVFFHFSVSKKVSSDLCFVFVGFFGFCLFFFPLIFD